MATPDRTDPDVDQVIGDLISTNEIGDGRTNYRQENGTAFLDVYDDDDMVDANGIPVPTATFRLDLTLTEAAVDGR